MKWIRTCRTIILATLLIAVSPASQPACAVEKPSQGSVTSTKSANTETKEAQIQTETKTAETPAPQAGDKQAALELDVCKAADIAIANNPNLKIAAANIEKARGVYHKAKSGLNFKLDLSGSYTYLTPIPSIEMDMGDNGPTKIDLAAKHNVNGTLALNKVITTFGKLENQIAAAWIQICAAQSSYEAAKQDIIFRTKQQYYQALKAKGFVNVAQETLKVAKSQLEMTQAMFKAGVVPRYDVLRAELVVSIADQGVINATNAYDLAIASLLNTLAIDQETKVNMKDDQQVVRLAVNLEAAQGLAKKNRPEIKAAEFGIKASKYLLESAKKGQLPTLVLNSTYQQETVSGFNSTPNSWASTVALAIPLFDGGETKGMIEQAKAQLTEAQQSLVSLLDGVELEVKQAVLELRDTIAIMEAADKDKITSEEGYSIARTRYQSGISTSVELDDALKTAVTSNTNYVNALYDYNIAQARLDRATATSWKGECSK